MNHTSKNEIIKELYKRCVAHGFKEVNIHTINNKNVTKVDEVLVELGGRDNFPPFDFKKDEDLPESGLYTFKIKIK